MKKIRVGIVGYGNLGAGVVKAAAIAPDMELCAVFTRRDPKTVKLQEGNVPILHVNAAEGKRGEIDVMLLCGGSVSDLPEQGPYFAKMFNIVDSFDTHAKIPDYLSKVNAAATSTTAIISAGWDPGLFSMLRLLSEAVLPDGITHTFWGEGVSQGHSDAIRRIDGVAHAVQYTIPIDSAIEAARSGEKETFLPRQKHKRDCYVAVLDGADKDRIESEIKAMPNYFADYDTTVTFVEVDELYRNHSKMPHGGVVLHSGSTGENKQLIEFSLKLDSNPEFTASVMVAYARTAYRLYKEGNFGAKTVFDIPLSYLLYKDRDDIVAALL